MKVTYTINDISVVYEGSVEEILKIGIFTVKQETSNDLHEYLKGIDLSGIPDYWDEVWVAQDFDGQVVAYRNKPVFLDNCDWWKRSGVDYCDLIPASEAGGFVEDWKESLFQLR